MKFHLAFLWLFDNNCHKFCPEKYMIICETRFLCNTLELYILNRLAMTFASAFAYFKFDFQCYYLS